MLLARYGNQREPCCAGYSWLGELEHNPVSKNGGYQVAGLPWDTQYLPKPALFGMYEALGHNVTEMTMGC